MAGPNDRAPWLDDVESELIAAAKKERIAGAALVMVDHTGIVDTLTLGFANRKTRAPFTAETRFPYANLSKVITAMAVLQLTENKQLALTSTLSQALPDLHLTSRFGPDVQPTLAQLLSHHSGLPSNVLAGFYRDQPPTDLSPLPDLYLASEPGQIYAYSNLAYNVLGRLVEHHSGQSFPEYVGQHILTPLNMGATGYSAHPLDSKGHDKKRRVEPDVFAANLPALGLRGTITDLGALLGFFLSEQESQVLSLAARQQMGSPQI